MIYQTLTIIPQRGFIIYVMPMLCMMFMLFVYFVYMLLYDCICMSEDQKSEDQKSQERWYMNKTVRCRITVGCQKKQKISEHSAEH